MKGNGKVQSKRSIKKTIREKRIAYFEVLLVVFILMLFLTAHYLHTIDVLDESNNIWMGIRVDNLFTDITLYSAIFLTFVLVILIINRNFDLKKRRVRK